MARPRQAGSSCLGGRFHEDFLSTGQNFQSPPEILEFVVEVQCDVTEEVEAVAEEGLEGALKCFLKRMGFCSLSNWPVL